MEDSELLCPKCEGEMEQGFLVDPRSHIVKPALWVEGTAELSLTRGTNIEHKRKHEVDAYRCVRCGFVELYAGMGDS